MICEIHQFHLHFSHGVLLLRSLEIYLSLVRYGVPCMGCFSSAFGSHFRVRSSWKNPNLKKFKRGFPAPMLTNCRVVRTLRLTLLQSGLARTLNTSRRKIASPVGRTWVLCRRWAVGRATETNSILQASPSAVVTPLSVMVWELTCVCREVTLWESTCENLYSPRTTVAAINKQKQ